MKESRDLKEQLVSVEVWDDNVGWQAYDCPDDATVESYSEWCLGEKSDIWATINNKNDKIRLNGWHVVDGKDYYNKRVEYLINEVLEDISVFGKNKECVLFVIKNELEDYEVSTGEPILKCSDEETKTSTLIDLLNFLISERENTRLGALLKANRLAEGLTQQTAADKVGVNIRTMQKWEAEERSPNGKAMFKLIRTLNIDPEKVSELLKS